MINLLNKQIFFRFKFLVSWKIPRNFTGNIEDPNGEKRWYFNGKFYRTDGPAIEYSNGNKEWWLNDERHRKDGPAVECSNGDKEWFLNGKQYSEEEWQKKLKNK